MTSKQRAYLMSLASNLNPIFQVGKSSLTPELTAAIGESFNNNELIKIGVLKNCFDERNFVTTLHTTTFKHNVELFNLASYIMIL